MKLLTSFLNHWRCGRRGAKQRRRGGTAVESGITMIEVIIVVALLAILLIISLSYINSSSLKRSRDSKRKDDLARLKVAVEEYYNDHGEYPPPEMLADCGGSSLSPYINPMPCDPASKSPYLYAPYPDTEDRKKGFRIYAPLEWTGDDTIDTIGCRGGCGLSDELVIYYGAAGRWRASDFNYGVSEGVPVGVPEGAASGEIEIRSGWCCNSKGEGKVCLNYSATDGGVCDGSAYATYAECVARTSCTQNSMTGN